MYRNLLAIGAAASLALAGCAQATSQGSFLSNEERESYGIGAMIGQQLGQQFADVDPQAFLDGVKDGMAGETQLGDQEIVALIQARVTREREAATQAAQELAERNEASGSAFRESFAQDAGVQTLASGLQYKVLEKGDGEVASEDDEVTVHYKASFIDGTEFDSSYGAEPVRVRLDRVIPGWAEALRMMPEGARWQIVVPPDLSYGAAGAGEQIEPGSTLVFELEVVKVG